MAALPRLFVAPERLRPPEPLRLVGPEHHYLSRVLRLGPGAEVLLLDGSGRLVRARLLAVAADALTLQPEATEGAATTEAQAPGGVTLCLGLLKGDRHDYVLQKATELGAGRLLSVACRRSVPALGGERAERRQARWQRIVTGAAQQCRRPDLPEVSPPLSFAEALAVAATAETRILLYEGPAPPLRQLLPAGEAAAGGIALFVGPEGGFDDAEVAEATAAGFLPASLGPRILRAETAAVAALAVLLTG